MPRDLYLRQTKKPLRAWQRLLITGLVLVTVVGLLLLVWNLQRHRQADELAGRFEAALGAQQYADALVVYREAQALAVQPGQDDQQSGLYRNVLTAMETQLDQQLSGVEAHLLSNLQLNDDEIALIQGLGEVSSLRLLRFTREIARQYLTGAQDYRTTSLVIGQLKQFDNLRDELASLDKQLAGLQAVRPAVISAEQLMSEQAWLAARKAFLTLAEQEDQVPFVLDYVRQRQQDCETALYDPLLSEALALIEQNRTFTAQQRLLELQPIFPEDAQIKAALKRCEKALPGKLERYRSVVEHLTIKPLIVRPDLAFDGDIYARAAQDTMITTVEFKRMLEQLYANNYILIDQSRLLPKPGETFGLDLPAGKKPFVLVLEGLNYYVSRRETGNCWDLVLDAENNVCGQYLAANGELVIDRQAEAIGILDQFVADHPDFSYDGAKGLITLTGYEGIFGRVTDPDQLDDRNQALQGNGYTALTLQAADYEKNRQAVAAIIERLKQTGWQFGTSTYAFIPVTSASLESIEQDWAKWQAQVAPLTGPVQALHFPNGGLLSFSDPRSLFYQSQGIQIFGGLGAAPYINRAENLAYIDKVQISGYSIKNPGLYRLDRLFDAAAVRDRDVREQVKD